jgi:hypothetical protein
LVEDIAALISREAALKEEGDELGRIRAEVEDRIANERRETKALFDEMGRASAAGQTEQLLDMVKREVDANRARLDDFADDIPSLKYEVRRLKETDDVAERGVKIEEDPAPALVALLEGIG